MRLNSAVPALDITKIARGRPGAICIDRRAPDRPIDAVGANDPASDAYIRGGDGLFSAAVDPASGSVYATWQDSRFSTVDQVVLSRSTDGGNTWGTATRLTASSFPASTAPVAGGLMIGDYEALTNVGNTFVAAFQVDNADSTNPTDIRLATFPG